jgi:DNA-nicking Smr family endonuclease
MAKKKSPPKEPGPKPFDGFKPFAAGLGEMKAKIEAERKAEPQKPAEKKPPPKRIEPPPKGASDRDDDLAFHRMMSGVVPLDAKPSRVTVTGEPRPKAAPRVSPAELRDKARLEAESVLDHLHHLVDDALRFEVTDDGARVEGRRVDVPPGLVRELRRGTLPIDGRLDLHGLAADVAREKVLEFLRTMRARGERCVLLIHGKGNHSPGGGVLRGEIAAWLSQGRAREHVSAFATAREEDGGAGAVYVALRKV